MGGGVFCNESSPTLTNNTISGNKADNGGGGGGVACYEDSSPTLTNNTITGNSADGGGGVGVECWNGSSPTLTNNTITGNSANGGGGVGCFCHELIASDRFSLTLTNNTISGNSATGAHGMGGGVDLEGSSATLTNNTISGNWVNDGDGGGVACEGGSPTLTNNTITGNSATDGGGVYCRASSSPIIKNTIIALSTKGGGLSCDSGDGACNPVVTYCDVWGNVGGDYVKFAVQTGKHGNLSQDPLFADAAARDFHLKSPGGRWTAAGWVLDTVTSPCLDAGDPKSACNLEPAPNGGRINMGAYGGTIYASKSP
jgi:parallel beta-helix repeat protein